RWANAPCARATSAATPTRPRAARPSRTWWIKPSDAPRWTDFPSPLAGEGGSHRRCETGEGARRSREQRSTPCTYPSSAFASQRHLLPQGEKEEDAPSG